MIMHTFAEALDFHGRAVVPFTTHAMSGLAPSNVTTPPPARRHPRSGPGCT
ncbi:hypothetical protein ACWEPR_02945 [Streptomyces sp. NPDC004290]